jgi:hypothetical protein
MGLGGTTWAVVRRLLAPAALLVACTGPALGDAPAAGPVSRVPKPAVAATAAGSCVEDTAFMRRNHMELIKHQRDLTVREGIRTTKHSLANCVTCHADPKTGRVTGSRDAFCEGCHAYAAVKLDCFECHADGPKASTTSASAGVPR